MTTGPQTPEGSDHPEGQPTPPPPPPPPGTGDQAGQVPPPGQESAPGQVPPQQASPQPDQPMPAQAPGAPMQQAPMSPDEEKLWAIAAHLGPLIIGIIAPLVVWLIFKDRSRFVDRQSKEALNMQISYLIYGIVAGLSIFVLIGFVLLPIVIIAWLVLMIIATVKAANFEDYRYPMIIRLIP